VVTTKTVMLPENAIKRCKKIATIDGFPTDNITDIIVIAISRLDSDIDKAVKSNDDFRKFVNDVIKETKDLIKDKMMSDKLYGWKEEYKEKLK